MFTPVVYMASPLAPLGIAPPPASGGLHGSHSENLADLFVSMDLNGTHISPPATAIRPSATRQQQKANGTAVKLSEPRRGYGDWAWPALMQRCLLLPESVLHCVVEFIPAPRVWNWSLHQLQRRHTLYVFCSIVLPFFSFVMSLSASLLSIYCSLPAFCDAIRCLTIISPLNQSTHLYMTHYYLIGARQPRSRTASVSSMKYS